MEKLLQGLTIPIGRQILEISMAFFCWSFMPLVRHVPSFSPLLLCGSCTVRDEFAYKDLLQVLEGKILRFWRQALSRHGRVCVCHRLRGWGALLGVPSLSTLAGLRGQASGA